MDLIPKQIDLHAFLSPIRSETRLYKQARFVHAAQEKLRLVVLGTAEVDLPDKELHRSGLLIYRLHAAWATLKALNVVRSSRVLRKLVGLLALLGYGARFAWLSITLRPRFITCHHLPLLPLCVLSSLLVGARLIYAPHELETERTGLRGIKKALSRWTERLCIGFVNHCVLVCEPIRDWYVREYGIQNTSVIRAIPEYRLDSKDAGTYRTTLRAQHGIPIDAQVFIYQGLIDSARGTDTLLHAFRAEGCTAHLVFMGYGDDVDKVKAEIRLNRRIHYIEAVSSDRILQHTSIADVGIFVVPGPISLSYCYSLPNKFFEYIFAGKPVIVSNNLQYLSELVVKHQLGVSIDANALIDVVQRFPLELNGFGERAAEYLATLDSQREFDNYKIIYTL